MTANAGASSASTSWELIDADAMKKQVIKLQMRIAKVVKASPFIRNLESIFYRMIKILREMTSIWAFCIYYRLNLKIGLR